MGITVANAWAQQNQTVQPGNTVCRLNVRDVDHPACVQITGGGPPQTSRTNETVPVSECKTISGLDTVPGEIDVKTFVIGTPLPLCINNGTLSSWYGVLDVYGGYAPYDGYVNVWQKGQIVGQIYLSWTDNGPLASCGEEWTLSYYVKTNFTLDSNQYPTITGDVVVAPYSTIPGKAVNLDYCSYWKGCHDRSQFFTILSAQQALMLSNILPFPQLLYAFFFYFVD